MTTTNGFSVSEQIIYDIGYQQGRADEREHILEILHGIDRQIENLVICVLASECNERLKEQK